MNAEPKLSPDLRATLSQIFVLGYCDAMKGTPVEDDDEIDRETASEVEAAVLAFINGVATDLEATYIENPQQVHDATYLAGGQAYRQAAALWMQRN